MDRSNSDRLDRQGQHVTNTALRLDDAGRTRAAFQLAPQPRDLHIDATLEDVLVHAGRLLQV